MDLEQAQRLSEILIGLAVLFQSIELLRIAPSVGNYGVWRWETLREEYSFLGPLRIGLDFLLGYPNVVYLFLSRAILGLLLTLFSHWIILALLLFCTILIALRWRGTFNGGSDYMSIIVLAALLIASASSENSAFRYGCILYIGLQTTSSYFVSGFVKLRKQNWRAGLALPAFLRSSIYQASPWVDNCARNRAMMLISSWGIILFELLFPLALVSPQLCLGFLALAVLFHFANFYIFGLNRFLFAWAAAYPAVYFCSLVLSG